MNKEVSDLASTNPKEVMYVVNRLYQARGADVTGLCRINKSSRLAAVDGLQECAM
jgi:hypothetical protein